MVYSIALSPRDQKGIPVKPSHLKAHGRVDTLALAYVLVIAFAVIPLLYIAKYSHISADDLAYGELTHPLLVNGGGIAGLLKAAWDTMVFFYNNWSGSYTGVFVQALQPGVFGEGYYWLTTPIMMAGIFLGFAMTCRLVFWRLLGIRGPYSWLVAAIMTCYALMCMPDTMQSLYWFNGAFGYTFMWGCGMLTVALAAGLVFRRSESVPRIAVRLVLASACAFVVAGGGHVPAFMTILMLLVVSVYSIWRRHNPLPIIPFIICCIGFYLVMAAPGTANRSGTLAWMSGGRTSVRWTLETATLMTIDHSVAWTNLSLLFTLVAATPVIWHLLGKADFDLRRIRGSWIFLAGLATLLLVGAELCVPLYAMKNEGDTRLTDGVFFAFASGALATWILALARIKVALGDGHPLSRTLDNPRHTSMWMELLFPACLLVVVVATSSQFAFSNTSWHEACSELVNGVAARYDAEMDGRIAALEDPGQPVVTLTPLQNKSPMLTFSDFASTEWGGDVCAYYQKRQVIVQNADGTQATFDDSNRTIR